MIVEMRTYTIKTGKLEEFVKIYDEEVRETHIRILGNQIGFFVTEFGELNQVIHLYGYKDYDDRTNKRKKLSINKTFINYKNKVANLIINQKNQILLPANFSKIK